MANVSPQLLWEVVKGHNRCARGAAAAASAVGGLFLLPCPL